MMALVDADYKFLYCDVGCNGRISDGGVFGGCSVDDAIRLNTINLPQPYPAPGDERPMSYFIVADDAFPLREYLLKPFPHRSLEVDKRVYNYRLSRARRVGGSRVDPEGGQGVRTPPLFYNPLKKQKNKILKP